MSRGPRKPPAFEAHARDYEEQLARGLRVSGESKEYFARSRVEHLRAFWIRSGRPEPLRVIDYGCGPGDVAALLAGAFPRARVVGVDESKALVDKARTLWGGERIEFLHREHGEPQRFEAADLVHLNGVVHHVRPGDRAGFFASLRSAVRPVGLVAVFENNPWNPGAHLVMRRISFDRGILPVPAGRVSRGLEAAGLRVVARRYLFVFPAPFRALRPLEKQLESLPFGAQYAIYAEPEGGSRGDAAAPRAGAA